MTATKRALEESSINVPAVSPVAKALRRTPANEADKVVSLPSINHVLADMDAKAQAVASELSNLPWTHSISKPSSQRSTSPTTEAAATRKAAEALKPVSSPIPEGAYVYMLSYELGGGDNIVGMTPTTLGLYRHFRDAVKAAVDEVDNYGFWGGTETEGEEEEEEEEEEGEEEQQARFLRIAEQKSDSTRWYFEGEEFDHSMKVTIQKMYVK